MIIGLWALFQIASQLHARKLDLREFDARTFDRELEQDLIELNQRALDKRRLEQRVLETAEPKAYELEGNDFAFEAENEINTLQKKGLKPTAVDVYKRYDWIRDAFKCLCPTKDMTDKHDSRKDGMVHIRYAQLIKPDQEYECYPVQVWYHYRRITVAYLPKSISILKSLFYVSKC